MPSGSASVGKTSALCYYKDGHFHTPDMAGVEAIADVSALCEYQGVLWIGTENYGLFALDYASEEVRRFTVDQGALSVNGILALVNDPQGGMWIGTSGGGRTEVRWPDLPVHPAGAGRVGEYRRGHPARQPRPAVVWDAGRSHCVSARGDAAPHPNSPSRGRADLGRTPSRILPG